MLLPAAVRWRHGSAVLLHVRAWWSAPGAHLTPVGAELGLAGAPVEGARPAIVEVVVHLVVFAEVVVVVV